MNNINILERKLIKSPWLDEANPSTRLSTCDQTSVAIATSRATFWRAHIDAQTLEKCLQLVLEDLPFLGGRMAPLKLPMGWKLGQLQVTNNNEGLEFTIAKAAGGLTLSNFGPNTWPMRNATISNPEVPPFIPRMDVGKKLLSGKEPLCKVQLTKVEDGSILAITLSHTITDGMHWPALMVHIAARYRQVASGIPAPTQELIECATSRTDLSLSRVKSNLMAEGQAEWQPEPFKVRPSLGDYFRAAGLLMGNAASKIQMDIIFLPRQRMADLKAAVVAASCEGVPVTTGDVVQAMAALAVHAAEGKPLLPVQPKCMVSLVQIPGQPNVNNYFGNAVHPMAVGMPQGQTLPEGSDYLGMLRTLAKQIRINTAEIRHNPAKALQALYESTLVCEAPVHRALAYLAGQRLPYVTCTTNYIGTLPGDSTLDFGIGTQQLGYRSLTYPLARSMAVVRPSMPPYGDGLFLSLNLTPSQAKRLLNHPLLPALVPDAVYLGEEGGPVAPPKK